jgi:Tol biopolymer transport system component
VGNDAIHLYDGVDTDLQTEGNDPAISRDRSKIAYVGLDGNVWTMAVDGINKHQITDGSKPLVSPSFGPDDTQLVFATWGNAGLGATVYTVSASASKAAPSAWKEVAQAPDGWIYHPRFVTANAIGFEYDFNPGEELDTIVVVDALKSGQTPSSASWKRLEKLNSADKGWYIGDPNFSDDGAKIVYVKGHGNSCAGGALMEAHLDESFDVSGVHEIYCAANHGVESPDFQRGAGTVAFGLMTNAGEASDDLYTIDVDGTNLTKRVSGGTNYVTLSFE